MKKQSRLIGLSALLIIFASCSNHAAKNASATPAKTDTTVTAPPASVITDTTINKNAHNKLNDVALYLAGMKPDSFIAIPEALSISRRYASAKCAIGLRPKWPPN